MIIQLKNELKNIKKKVSIMQKRYSQMTEDELRQEIADLKAKIQEAEQAGMVSQVAVFERKIVMAQSYQKDLNEYRRGDLFYIKDEDGNTTFRLDYLDGVFGWGYYGDETEMRAIPISMLIKKES